MKNKRLTSGNQNKKKEFKERFPLLRQGYWVYDISGGKKKKVTFVSPVYHKPNIRIMVRDGSNCYEIVERLGIEPVKSVSIWDVFGAMEDSMNRASEESRLRRNRLQRERRARRKSI